MIGGIKQIELDSELKKTSDMKLCEIAEEYLKNQKDGFYYKAVGVIRTSKSLASVSVLWSNAPNTFTIDGLIPVDIDLNTEQVIRVG
ncbi:MAG: hypothetical protein KC451_01980 [Amylibacter sp.]|nr:hypothetical protein [Amylibacter sp.]